MERDEIAFGEQPGQRNSLSASSGDRIGGGDRIAHEHAAAKGDEPAHDAPADPAEADDATGHAGERAKGRRRRGEFPFAVMHQPAVRWHLAREGKDEGERMVGHLVDAVVGDVADGNAVGSGGGEIHVVNADPVADDHAGPLHRPDDIGVYRRKLRDHGVGIGHRCGEPCGVFRLGAHESRPCRGRNRLLRGKVGEGMVRDDDFHGVVPMVLGNASAPDSSATAPDSHPQ